MLHHLSVSTSHKVMRNTRSTPFSEILSNIFYCEIVMLCNYMLFKKNYIEYFFCENT